MIPAWALLAVILFCTAAVAGLYVLTERRRRAVEGELGETRQALREAEGRASAAAADLRAAEARAEAAARLEETLAAERAGRGAAERDLAAVKSSLAERERALKEFREEMEQRFTGLANAVLEKQSETLGKANKERLDALLSPLKDQIVKFESAFKQDGETRAAQSSSLRTLIETLSQRNEETREVAANLTRALKGQAQVQGAWGEMILRTILEKAGLRAGEEFVIQDHQTTDEGARHRPDVVVNFPDGKKLVVDSKVSLTAFERCVNCEDEAEREAHLKDHLDSLRRHIKGLSEKDYAQHYGGVDFVILFVPVEGALSLAIQNDPDIQTHAVGMNVMIASPNTLLMGLRTVQNMWVRERQHQNAQAIADRAGKLYDKFVGFVDDLEKVGSSLDRARSQYDDALGKLSTGRGNLVGQAEKLKRMGAQTAKQLPEKVLAMTDADDADTPEGDAQGEEAAKGAVKKRGKANHPESIPPLNDETAETYDEMNEKEKEVAAAISQDWDA